MLLPWVYPSAVTAASAACCCSIGISLLSIAMAANAVPNTIAANITKTITKLPVRLVTFILNLPRINYFVTGLSLRKK